MLLLTLLLPLPQRLLRLWLVLGLGVAEVPATYDGRDGAEECDGHGGDDGSGDAMEAWRSYFSGSTHGPATGHVSNRLFNQRGLLRLPPPVPSPSPCPPNSGS